MLSCVAVRSTGFPADVLRSLRVLDPQATPPPTHTPDTAPHVLAEALRLSTSRILDICNTPAFREALAWQNPSVLQTLDSMRRRHASTGRNAKWRDREHRLVRYIARYYVKTETVGFFGPISYASLNDSPGHLVQRPGTALLAQRSTFAEPWAVRALGARLAQIPDVRQWLLVRRPAHHPRRHEDVLTDAGTALSGLDRAILQRADGTLTPVAITTDLEAAGIAGHQEVIRSLNELDKRGLVVVDAT